MNLTSKEIAEIVSNQANVLLTSQEGGSLDREQIVEFCILIMRELNKLNGNN